ncbi:MAG: class III extradiol ring-cleavage dioxygenase [Burkholderiales bacterium]
MSTMPAIFVSHGAPTLVFEPVPARDFLRGLGQSLPAPRAILAVSAHWETAVPTVSAAQRPETIHDFYGFPPELYRVRYAAPGAPELAQRVAELLDRAKTAVDVSRDRGLDHGAWVPLVLAYPGADIPVTQLSIQSARGPAWHWALGEALRPLREEGVLILASGSITHNLRDFGRQALNAAPAGYAAAFSEWLAAAITEGRHDDLIAYRKLAPEAARNHPTEEHLLPLFVAAGAGSTGRGERLHASYTYGAFAMDVYRFD